MDDTIPEETSFSEKPADADADAVAKAAAALGAPAPGAAEPRASDESASADSPEAAEGTDSGAPEAAPEAAESAPKLSAAPAEPRAKPRRPAVTAATTEGEHQWFVLRVQSGREDTVSNNLRKKLTLHGMDDRVQEVAVPKQKMTEIKEGKKRVRAQKVFPGYIFVNMMLDDDLWYLIRDTNGIGDFVGSQSKPVPMSSAEVKKVLDIMEEKEEPKEVKIDLHKHDAVKIKEGPFENFDGIVEEVNPQRGIVRVMVAIFGRSTPVDLEYWQVEKL